MSWLVWEYLCLYRRRWLVGVLLALIATGFSVVSPWLLGQAINSFSGEPSNGWPLWQDAAGILVASLGEAAGRFGGRLVVTGGSRVMETDLRRRYFARLAVLDRAFFEKRRTGDLVARATNDLSAVRQLFGPALSNVLQTIILLVTVSMLMFSISSTLALWALLALPCAFAIFVVTRKRIEERFTRVQEQFAAMSDHAEETFAGVRVVRAYAQEPSEIEAFRRTSYEYAERQISQERLEGLLWPAMTLVTSLLVVLLLYVGGREVVEGRLTLGGFVQFSAYLGELGWPMMALAWVTALWQRGMASAHRIEQVLEAEPRIAEPLSPQSPSRAGGKIELRNVGLQMDGRVILHDVSLTIPAGSSVALVGPLGSGKSALAALLPRLHDVTSGQVLVDGVDVRDRPLAELRQEIGYVPQESFLFSGTLKENVLFGVAEHADDVEERAERAVRVSRLENDLDQWPNGIDTLIGERGITLSGGQKQRTAIARAVAKEPPVLILDDALSSVDARTEEAILGELRAFMRGRTTLIIAHRLSATRLAQEVVVLDKGTIVEHGSHQDLVQRGGLYSRIYRRQLMEQEMDLDDQLADLETDSYLLARDPNGVA